ncbi:MAG: hypothetical protein P8046_01275 [Anaerolineales bacterium]
MNTPINLKELEQKAFRSFFQDGIWDIFFGLIMLAMYISSLFNESGNSGLKTLSLILPEIFAVMFLIFGKKYITAPRLGNVEFGKARKRRLVYIFGINLITLILALGLFFSFQWLPMTESQTELLSPIGLGVWIAFMTSLMAFFLDFDRLYIYGLIYGATFTAVLLLDWPILFLVASLLILLPGLAIFTRFLMTNKPVEEG